MRSYRADDFPALLERLRRADRGDYFAMYSSLYEGIVTDPALMLLPIDDHMAHRGDGVFEAIKCVAGRIYNLQAHLDRLEGSARFLNLALPAARTVIESRVVETVRAGGRPDCVIRLFVSRGPGGFSADPAECPRSQLYIVVTALGVPFMRRHPEGARVRIGRTPPKQAAYAGVKSCNYLPNVLMKQEARAAGVDFVVAVDEAGRLAESATENVAVVTGGRLTFPRPDRALRGTTMMRILELARALVADGRLREAGVGDVLVAEAATADEVLITGTTQDVVAVVEFEGRPVGGGTPGPVYAALSGLLLQDIRGNAAVLTPAFE